MAGAKSGGKGELREQSASACAERGAPATTLIQQAVCEMSTCQPKLCDQNVANST